MPRRLTRPLFGLERVWLVADRTGPPFVNQLVVEGEGTLDPPAWEAALAAIRPGWPAAHARLSGALGWTRWSDDGAPPRVRVATDPVHAGFTACDPARLDPWRGPVVEVVLHPGAAVMRTHHAAFDGQAAWALAEDLGAALRGAPVRGAAFEDVVEPRGGGARPEPPADVLRPSLAGSDTGWARVTLPLRSNVTGRGLAAFAGACGGRIRASIPVDLRGSERREAANLTGFVHLEVAPDESPGSVRTALLAGRGSAVDALRSADRLRNLPLWLLEAAGRRAAEGARRMGSATSSMTLSNLGRQDAGVFDHGSFRGRALYWIPPVHPGTPLFVTFTGHDGGVEVCAGGVEVDGAALVALLARVERGWLN